MLFSVLLGKKMTELLTLGTDFVFGYIQAMDGEKDPRNLLVCLELVQIIVMRFPIVCRHCIIKYLQLSKYCPTCNMKVHETQPLLNVRLDRTMQDIVYKVIPNLFEDEEVRERKFYEERRLPVPKKVIKSEGNIKTVFTLLASCAYIAP
ncbi:polycomb group RING finger protein 1-like [Xenia sp. Carnegie-2017]|uniref:polycomb group RING finger protein 1-like n=1 Tax=Xenia sp. Carnegie-2017 TaxID=2897299 RepID=UPI001F0420A7|nr:polycomb group RING finger protein 1-like [Xenia sp. Carnegie-2017]